jgi:hypothetical protein
MKHANKIANDQLEKLNKMMVNRRKYFGTPKKRSNHKKERINEV